MCFLKIKSTFAVCESFWKRTNLSVCIIQTNAQDLHKMTWGLSLLLLSVDKSWEHRVRHWDSRNLGLRLSFACGRDLNAIEDKKHVIVTYCWWCITVMTLDLVAYTGDVKDGTFIWLLGEASTEVGYSPVTTINRTAFLVWFRILRVFWVLVTNSVPKVINYTAYRKYYLYIVKVDIRYKHWL